MKRRRSLGDCILSNSFRRLHQSGHSCGLCCFLLPLLQYLWENFSNISGISAKPDFVNPDFWDLTIAKFWQFMGTKMLLCDHWPTSRTRVIKLSWTLTFTTTTKKMAAAAWVNAKDEISRRRPLPPRYVLSCQVIMQGGAFFEEARQIISGA